MEIKIDTKNDSKQDIKNVIKLLQSLVDDVSQDDIYSKSYDMKRDETTTRANTYESEKKDYDTPSEGLFDIFNSANETETKKEKDLFNIDEKNDEYAEEKKEEKKNIDLVPY